MARVEFDCGEEAFTVGKRSSIGNRSSSIGKRRGSIVGSGKGGRVVEGIAWMHLVIRQGDYCQSKVTIARAR